MAQNQTIDYWLSKTIKEQKIDAQISLKTFPHYNRVRKAKVEYIKSLFNRL